MYKCKSLVFAFQNLFYNLSLQGEQGDELGEGGVEPAGRGGAGDIEEDLSLGEFIG